MFSVVVARQEEHDERREERDGRNEVADVEADLLLDVDDRQVGDAAADVYEPVKPVEERMHSLLAEPLHLPTASTSDVNKDWTCKDQDKDKD